MMVQVAEEPHKDYAGPELDRTFYALVHNFLVHNKSLSMRYLDIFRTLKVAAFLGQAGTENNL
jgi:hypothetical protein